MRRYRFLALILVLALVAPGCARRTSAQTLLMSGETINATGELFVNTAAFLVPLCNAKTLPKWETVCPAFKTFEQKFKGAWPMATGLWYAARKANDPKLEAPAETAVGLLRAELNTFVKGGK